MFEHRKDRLLPWSAFILRMLRSSLIALGVVCIGLTIGTVGYHAFAGLDWVDAFLNASMILTGMGPVNPLNTTSAKLFASFYAIFSGVAFPTTIGILLAPVVHRFLHRLHMEHEHDKKVEHSHEHQRATK